MKKMTLAAVGAAGMMCSTVLANDIIYDNGGPDGSNGYSNGTVNAFGIRRTLLDDFTLDADYTLKDFHWQHIWNTFPAGSGSGMELTFHSDAGGAPNPVPIATATITSYSEMGTGVTYFSRPGAESWVTFDGIDLSAGTYWFQAAIVGPENNFWLVQTTVTGSECWVNYDDLGFGPGTDVFGVAADLNFYITGSATPAPGALALLGLAGFVGRRRRR